MWNGFRDHSYNHLKNPRHHSPQNNLFTYLIAVALKNKKDTTGRRLTVTCYSFISVSRIVTLYIAAATKALRNLWTNHDRVWFSQGGAILFVNKSDFVDHIIIGHWTASRFPARQSQFNVCIFTDIETDGSIDNSSGQWFDNILTLARPFDSFWRRLVTKQISTLCSTSPSGRLWHVSVQNILI